MSQAQSQSDSGTANNQESDNSGGFQTQSRKPVLGSELNKSEPATKEENNTEISVTSLAGGGESGRVMVGGVITEVSEISDEFTKARLVTGDGAIVDVTAGGFAPDVRATLSEAEDPADHAVLIGKADLYKGDIQLNAEKAALVDEATVDSINVDAAADLLQRMGEHEFDEDEDDVEGALSESLQSALRTVAGIEDESSDESEADSADEEGESADEEESSDGEPAVNGYSAAEIQAGLEYRDLQVVAGETEAVAGNLDAASIAQGLATEDIDEDAQEKLNFLMNAAGA
jgi:RPA family protein